MEKKILRAASQEALNNMVKDWLKRNPDWVLEDMKYGSLKGRVKLCEAVLKRE